MGDSVLGCKYGTEGKATAALGIVGDGDAVGLRVVADGVTPLPQSSQNFPA